VSVRGMPVLPISYTYTSLYATPDNETHFRTVQVQLDPVENFALPAQPVGIGGSQVSSRAFFLAFPLKWGESDLQRGIWHPTPVRQFGTVLRGHIVTYASDGATLDMGPGDTCDPAPDGLLRPRRRYTAAVTNRTEAHS
jgi:hypothetical protein